jgi:uncharacterized membrane protein
LYPREEREVQVELQALTWNAPIPPPEILQGYNAVIPDGAERLFKQFEVEASARREYMRRGQTHNLIVALSGRGAALIFALSALAVSAFALQLGHPWAASIIGGTTIAMVVAAFTGVPALIRQHLQQREKGR